MPDLTRSTFFKTAFPKWRSKPRASTHRAGWRWTRFAAALACLTLMSQAAEGAAGAQKEYEKGMLIYEEGDLERAAAIWRPLAESGNAIAQYSLGKLYETGGMDFEQNYSEAAKWYRLAAAAGIPAAQNNLGLMYAQGRGVARDPARAVELWTAAARQDHAMAQFNLALAYYRGEGIPQDKTKAEQWFERAANNGLAEAQYAMGQIRLLGLSGKPDRGEALNWYQLAAAQGHGKAREQAQALRGEGIEPRLAERASGTPLRPAGEAPSQPSTKAAEPEAAAASAAERVENPKAGLSTAEGDRPALPAPPAKAPDTPPSAAARKTAPPLPESPGAKDAGASSGKQVARAAPGEPASAAAGGTGLFQVWLRSEGSRDAAEAYLRGLQAAYPDLMAGARGEVVQASHGKGGTFYRVLASGLADRGSALALCQRVRQATAENFCALLPVGK